MFDFIDRVYEDTAHNLALEEVLLSPALKVEPQPCLRIWENPERAVVLGRGEKIEKQVCLEKTKQADVPVYRRLSGGGTVVHGPGNVNISFILPYSFDSTLNSIKQSYLTIHAWVATALEELSGKRPEILGGSDLTLNGRKISGTAQARKRFGLLHHMTLLVDFDLSCIPDLLQEPEKQPDYREKRSHEKFVTTLKQESCDFELKKFTDALAKVLGGLNKRDLTVSENKEVEDLVTNKYSCPLWNNEGRLKSQIK